MHTSQLLIMHASTNVNEKFSPNIHGFLLFTKRGPLVLISLGNIDLCEFSSATHLLIAFAIDLRFCSKLSALW